MNPKEQNELIIEAVRWTARSAGAIQRAGGAVDSLLDKFPDDLLVTFVRNNLNLTFNRKN